MLALRSAVESFSCNGEDDFSGLSGSSVCPRFSRWTSMFKRWMTSASRVVERSLERRPILAACFVMVLLAHSAAAQTVGAKVELDGGPVQVVVPVVN